MFPIHTVCDIRYDTIQ